MLNDLDRQALYERLAIPSASRVALEEMRLASPSRKVGEHALNNVVVRLPSPLMGHAIEVESRTCEAIFVMETEVSRSALEIWPQVELRRIERLSECGRRSVNNATVDFLVYRDDAICLVECKPQKKIQRLAERDPREWVRTSTGWSRPPLEAWANQRGMRYEIWSPPELHSLYGANLFEIYSQIGCSNESTGPIVDRLVKAAAGAPITLRAAVEKVPNLKIALVLKLIAGGVLFGTLKGALIDEPEQFYISTDRVRCEELDRKLLEGVETGLRPLCIADPVLRATKTDYSRGKARLERAERILAGDSPSTRRYAPLVKAVVAAKREGRNPLAVCITRYADCGYRDSRITDVQEDAITKTIEDFWDSGLALKRVDLWIELKKICKARGISDIPSQTTLNARIKSRPREKRDLAVGGKRQYHANRPPSDPRLRGHRALAPFSNVHIDATKFDNRVSPDVLDLIPFSCPVLYTAIDEATDDVVGRSLAFGNASRFGLNLLLRDMVFRHGRLPTGITLDRGSDLQSETMKEVALEYRIAMRKRPSGAPRYGSTAENSIGRINSDLAHRLPGSTLPDQKGRSVDGRFKSYATARIVFSTIVQILDEYLFEIRRDQQIDSHEGSPFEQTCALTNYFGEFGRCIALDDKFILLTSVPIGRKHSLEGNRLRTASRTYTSADLTRELLLGRKAEEWRLDCANPSRAYGKFGTAWITALASDCVRYQVRSPIEGIFEVLYGPDRARRKRAAKVAQRDRVLDLVDRAKASAPATEHLDIRLSSNEQPLPGGAIPLPEVEIWGASELLPLLEADE